MNEPVEPASQPFDRRFDRAVVDDAVERANRVRPRSDASPAMSPLVAATLSASIARTLRDQVRVPVYLFLSAWSVYAVWSNWSIETVIDVVYSASYAAAVVYMVIDGAIWCRRFTELRRAKAKCDQVVREAGRA